MTEKTPLVTRASRLRVLAASRRQFLEHAPGRRENSPPRTAALPRPSTSAGAALALLGACLLAAVAAFAQDAPATNAAPLFPFALPWDDASPGVTSLTGWNTAPAGQAGPIRVGDDGHFYEGANRIRFLGVNFCFGAALPEKTDAGKIAARLARFGINVVRFHHLDTQPYPSGICAAKAQGTGVLHPAGLDRLDYFVAQLKQHGIYVNMNLLVGRPFNAGDGLPPEIERLEAKARHVVGFFHAPMRQLQKDYARALLAHRNPHTGLTYAEDPAVAFVEIHNENGLIHGLLRHGLEDLPEVFQRDLQQQWNHWLRQRHPTTSRLRQSWNVAAQPVGDEMLAHAGFDRDKEGWTLEQLRGARARVTFSSNAPPALRQTSPSAQAARIEILQPGPEPWHLQWYQTGLKLRAGQAYTLRFWTRAPQARALSVSVMQHHEPWAHLGLAADIAAKPSWQEHRFVFQATQDDDRVRVGLSKFGQAGSVIELAGFSLRPGGLEGLRPDEQPESGTVPLFAKATLAGRARPAQEDWMRFLYDTENGYWQEIHRFLKDDLKVRGLVTGTIIGCAPASMMASFDWTDTHAYWQHPSFPVKPWDPENWLVKNISMVNSPGGTLPGLALRRVLGKPHAVTEYNHPAPNTYSSEACPLLAAWAAFQDWDAIYFFTYAHNRKDGWDLRRFTGFFDLDQHPLKMATLVPAAALFRRGDVQPAHEQIVAALSRDREIERLRDAREWSLGGASQEGVAAASALVHRVALASGEKPVVPAGALPASTPPPAGPIYTSDTGELTWDLSQPQRGVVSIATPRSQAVIGYGGGRRFELGDVRIEPGATRQDGWSVITVTQLDAGAGKAIGVGASPAAKPARRWLITATGHIENTGMVWKNPERSSVGRNWGQAPTLIEGVPARITFRRPGGKVTAWALDERGQRTRPVKVATGPEQQAQVPIGPEWQTLWYEVVAE